VVPVRLAGTVTRYITRRGQLMGNIEQDDVQRLKSQQQPDGSE
jgi:hypothetical protein